MISVTFTPTAKGVRTAAVSIADGGGGSPQTISLTGSGTVVSVTPSSLNFGSQQVGTISPGMLISVTNLGATTLNITGINITGINSTDFIQTNSCGTRLPAGGTCSIIVNFIPTKTGTRTASVNVNDDGGGSPQTVRLSGTGT